MSSSTDGDEEQRDPSSESSAIDAGRLMESVGMIEVDEMSIESVERLGR